MIRLGLIMLCLMGGQAIPFLKKKYTPLVFFTVPPGFIPEVDEMEKVVRQVEKELRVRVERMDILKDPTAEAALALLTSKTPPFLYHRESCQVVHVNPRQGNDKKDMPVKIDTARVRAWAKGRFITNTPDATKVASPTVIAQDDQALSQDDLLDMGLTPEQRKGQKAMKERSS